MIIHRLRRILTRLFVQLRWQNLLIGLLVYIAVSWVLLVACGETELIQWPRFFYWLVVTGSTVGYGDFSPTTEAGQWVVSLVVIPFGLSLFALTVGHIAAFATQQWKKGVRGLKALSIDNHILVIGWNDHRTLHLLRLLLREEADSGVQRPVVLCCDADIENPLPDQIGFVRVGSYSDHEDMQRACPETAACIIIDSESDEITMTSALYCYGVNPSAHTIAYFQNESLSDILKKHCPNVECTPSVSVEMMAKAAVDPGSSALHHELLNVAQGMTQYSVRYPDDQPEVPVEALFVALKKAHAATLIGLRPPSAQSIVLNPALDQAVTPGTTLYYIADDRITHFSWGAFNHA